MEGNIMKSIVLSIVLAGIPATILAMENQSFNCYKRPLSSQEMKEKVKRLKTEYCMHHSLYLPQQGFIVNPATLGTLTPALPEFTFFCDVVECGRPFRRKCELAIHKKGSNCPWPIGVEIRCKYCFNMFSTPYNKNKHESSQHEAV